MLKKTNDATPRKCTEGQTEGWKDGQTLFYRTLPATVGDPKSTTCLTENLNVLIK